MPEQQVDVLLVGGGVMSATLGTMLAQVDPSLSILMAERLDRVAAESSDGWNNAGTGHAGYCELNYTPQAADGSVAINRALAINAAFETSLQLWSGLVEKRVLPEPTKFINPAPHLSLVWGENDVAFLRERHAKLSAHHLFADMQYSEDRGQLAEWMPLAMQQRDSAQALAATRVAYGSDVDFGALTRHLVSALQQHSNFELRLKHEVASLDRLKNGKWRVRLRDHQNGKDTVVEAGFVFLGAGGGALPLLQKSGIAESRGYGGFPVSGQWLVCNRPEVVSQHHAKVYGKAPLGAPPMSVPHLDTRIIDGKPALLFGPFAGFTTKFQKRGSYLDLISSIKPNNLKSMLGAGFHNMDLTRYLIGEVFQSHAERVAALRNFYPDAREEDWTLAFAGKRVQIIKQCGEKWGKLEFGTEIVAAADGSLAALLGASPGASTSVPAMIDVLKRCFGKRFDEAAWRDKMQALVPSYGQSLVENADLLHRVRQRTLSILGLQRD
ncbi:malate dehydrogenase (quinone) [Novimethylophilus kurashikiensis]|uniref:Probable malate:quinone oxidoreductase n=1 Tax=Novimethylophilus kurashikiensis TaxID=1825523 RepID=A0A2R5F699_9PROT|nr:malate dehydrogenase (quinone) [Novimethylophilus kurashikiensis]GBG13108.1 malate dehydrogenase (quinone) [Novimethylophilus kurashikiensis]